MSDTIVDMPKVTQMLDSGWMVRIYRAGYGSYIVSAQHEKQEILDRVAEHFPYLYEDGPFAGEEGADWDDGWLITDDFTPQQALTRMAYKVFGEII